MSSRRDAGSPFHDADLIGTLDQPQFVKNVTDVDQLSRGADARALLGFDFVKPLNELAVEFGITSHTAVDLGPVLKQSGQDVIDIFDGKRIIGLKGSNSTFKPCPAAVPGFFFCIALTAEDNVLPLGPSRRKYHHGFWFSKPSQILKITVRAKRILNIAVAAGDRCGWQDGNPVTHQLHDVTTTLCIDLRFAHGTDDSTL